MPASDSTFLLQVRRRELACKLTSRSVHAFYEKERGAPLEGRRKVSLNDGSRLSLVKRGTNGAFIWLLRFTFLGKRREIHLGMYPSLSLEQARQAAWRVKELVSQGIDPVLRRREVAIQFRKSAEAYSERTRAAIEAQPRRARIAHGGPRAQF